MVGSSAREQASLTPNDWKINMVDVTKHQDRMIPLIACLAIGAAASLFQGQDINYDLKNYHLYNAFAILYDRWGIDLSPPGFQGYFNPLGDLPYYWMAVEWFPDSPRLVAAFQGLFYGLFIYAALLISHWIFRREGPWTWWLAAIATIIGVTAAGSVAEIGTTFNDIQPAVFILFGLRLLLPACERAGFRTNRYPVMGAGLLVGIGIGLKLYAGIFALAAAIALIIVPPERIKAAWLSVLFAVSAIVGFLISYGWWGWLMWTKFGNPMFPLFNGIFRSEWQAPRNFLYEAYLPSTIWKAIAYPFYWITTQNTTAEIFFRDARLACATVAIVILLGAFVMSKTRADFDRSAVFVVCFAILSYGFWVKYLSMLRFGLILEALSGTLIVMAVLVISRAIVGQKRGRRDAAVASFVSIAILACLWSWTIYPSWGRIPFGDRVFALTDPPKMEERALIVTVSQPIAYVIPLLKPNRRPVVGITWALGDLDTRLFAETAKRIADHTDPILVLVGASAGNYETDVGARLGLTWNDCRPLVSNISPSGDLACVGQRVPGNRP
jgi:hypothetical protein